MNAHEDRSFEIRLWAADGKLAEGRVREAESVSHALAESLAGAIRRESDIGARLRLERLRVEAQAVLARALDAQWRHREGLEAHRAALDSARSVEGPWSLRYARCLLGSSLANARSVGALSVRLWLSCRGMLIAHGERGMAFDPARNEAKDSTKRLRESGLWATGVRLDDDFDFPVHGLSHAEPTQVEVPGISVGNGASVADVERGGGGLESVEGLPTWNALDYDEPSELELEADRLADEDRRWRSAGELGCIDAQWLLWLNVRTDEGNAWVGSPVRIRFDESGSAEERCQSERRACWIARLEELWERTRSLGAAPALQAMLALDLALLRADDDPRADLRRVSEAFDALGEAARDRVSRWSIHAGPRMIHGGPGFQAMAWALSEALATASLRRSDSIDSPLRALVANAVADILTRARKLGPLDATPGLLFLNVPIVREFIRRFASDDAHRAFEVSWPKGDGIEAADGPLRWTSALIRDDSIDAMVVRGEVERIRELVYRSSASDLETPRVEPCPNAEIALWRHDSPDPDFAIQCAMLYGGGGFVPEDLVDLVDLEGSPTLPEFDRWGAAWKRLEDWVRNAACAVSDDSRGSVEAYLVDLTSNRWNRPSGWYEALGPLEPQAFVEHGMRCILGMKGRARHPLGHEWGRDVRFDILGDAWYSRHRQQLERTIEDWTAVIEVGV